MPCSPFDKPAQNRTAGDHDYGDRDERIADSNDLSTAVFGIHTPHRCVAQRGNVKGAQTRLDDLFIDQQAISKEVYTARRASLEEQLVAVKVAMHDCQTEELDIVSARFYAGRKRGF